MKYIFRITEEKEGSLIIEKDCDLNKAMAIARDLVERYETIDDIPEVHQLPEIKIAFHLEEVREGNVRLRFV